MPRPSLATRGILFFPEFCEVIQTRFSQPFNPDLYQSMLADYLADRSDGSELFALRCQMFREQIADEPHDLLFIPVGYSHQGPILAALAAPAREIFLLCSPSSWAVGEKIQQALSEDFALQLLRIDPIDEIGKSVV